MIGVGDRISLWVVDDLVSLTEPVVARCHHVDEVDRIAFLELHRRTPANETRQARKVAALRALDHECIPRLIEAGLDAATDMLWVATTPFPGEPLSELLQENPIDWRDACSIFRQVADALGQMHGLGLVHRDISPAAIRVGLDWRVYLVGLDLCMEADELARTATPPTGDLSYVAPEAIADANHHAPRADLYALGCSFYEALTGKSPFPAASWGESADAGTRALGWKTRAEALDPGEVAPPWLSGLIRKATDAQSEKRLPDMEAFIGWLDAAQAGWVRPNARATPAPVSRIPVSLVPFVAMPQATMVVPSAETIREARRRSTRRPPGPPPALLYLSGAALGMVTALAFSSLVILFAEAGRQS
jgi:serine/threonine protein kinase